MPDVSPAGSADPTPAGDVCQKCQIHPVSGTVHRTRCICLAPMTAEETLRGVAGLGGAIGDAVRDLLGEVERLRPIERRARDRVADLAELDSRNDLTKYGRGAYTEALYIATGEWSS